MPYPDNFNSREFERVWGEKEESEADLYMEKMQWVWVDLLNTFKEHCKKNQFKVSLFDVEVFAEGITDTLQRIVAWEKMIDFNQTSKEVYPENKEEKICCVFSEIVTFNKIVQENQKATKANMNDLLIAVCEAEMHREINSEDDLALLNAKTAQII